MFLPILPIIFLDLSSSSTPFHPLYRSIAHLTQRLLLEGGTYLLICSFTPIVLQVYDNNSVSNLLFLAEKLFRESLWLEDCKNEKDKDRETQSDRTSSKGTVMKSIIML